MPFSFCLLFLNFILHQFNKEKKKTNYNEKKLKVFTLCFFVKCRFRFIKNSSQISHTNT